MEIATRLQKINFKSIHDTISSGDYSHLLSMGSIGVFKYKALIVKAMVYESSSFAESEPYARTWKILRKLNAGVTTDGFNNVVYKTFAAVLYDIDSGIRVKDDVILTLASQYFRGALVNEVMTLTDIIGYNAQLESSKLNMGYQTSVETKVSTLYYRELGIRQIGEEALEERIAGKNSEVLLSAGLASEGTLLGIPEPESTVETGEWIRLPDNASNEIVDLPFDDPHSFHMDFDQSKNPIELTIDKQQEFTAYAIDSVDDFTDNDNEEEKDMSDKLDFDKEHQDRDVREAVAEMENNANASHGKTVKSKDTSRAEIAKLNAQWHAKKAAGAIPADEELPEELKLTRDRNEDMDSAMAQAFKQAKKKKGDGKPHPLDVDANTSQPFLEQGNDGDTLELSPDLFANGPRSFMPEEIELPNAFSESDREQVNDIANAIINEDNDISKMYPEHVIKGQNPDFDGDALGPISQSKSKNTYDVTNRQTDLKKLFKLEASLLTANDEFIALYDDYNTTRSTGILNKLLSEFSSNFANEISNALLVSHYKNTGSLLSGKTELVTMSGKPYFSERDSDDLSHCKYDDKFMFDINGLPVIYSKAEASIVDHTDLDRIVNGVITDSEFNCFVKAYGDTYIARKVKAFLHCGNIDIPIQFQTNCMSDDKPVIGSVSDDVLNMIMTLDEYLD